MKKSLFCSTVIAFSGACSAQAADSVRLYGIVDVGLSYVTGVNGSNSKQVVSGIMEGTRWGLRGDEDLGGGWRALYRLESRVEADTGEPSNRPITGSQVPDRLNQAALLFPTLPAPVQAALQPVVSQVAGQLGATLGVNLPTGGASSRVWDRIAYVGLVTPFGAVLAGRQYTPAYEVQAEFDTLGTQSSLAFGQVGAIPAAFDIRANNALQYRIVIGGITASAMYAFGEDSLNSQANRIGGAMVMYNAGTFAVGAGYNQRNNDFGLTSLKSLVLGAWMDVGPGKVSAMVGSVEDDNPSLGVRLPTGALVSLATALTLQGVPAPSAALVQSGFTEGVKQDARLMHVGYKMTAGPNTFYVAYNSYNDRKAANADVASYGVAYSYALSKRTDLNAVLTHFDNKGLGQAAPGQAGFLGGVTTSAGTDSNNVAFGIRHRF